MFALILFLLFGLYFSAVFGDCELSKTDIETIQNEFQLAVTILKFGIPGVLGFTYFVFSLLGYSIAVWHMNQNQIKSKEGSLPDDQQKILNAYKNFKKLVNSIGFSAISKKESFKELEEIENEMSKISKKESEKQNSNNHLLTLSNEPLQSFDEFNLLPEKPQVNTNRDHAFEAQSNPSRPQVHQNLNNNHLLPPPTPAAGAIKVVQQKPEESLDTIRQAIEHDRLEAEYQQTIKIEAATAGTEKEKEAAAVVHVVAAGGDLKSDVTQKSSH